MTRFIVMCDEEIDDTFGDSFASEYSGIEHPTYSRALDEMIAAKEDPDLIGYTFYIREVER